MPLVDPNLEILKLAVDQLGELGGNHGVRPYIPHLTGSLFRL
jgi:hypothetical protein